MSDQAQQKTGMAIWGQKKASPPPSESAVKNNITSLISVDSVITGDIKSSSGYKIDGKVIGNITILSDKDSLLLITEHAFVEGNLEAPRIYIYGKVRGIVRAKEIRLSASANVDGEMYYEKLIVSEGAEVLGYLKKAGEDQTFRPQNQDIAHRVEQ